MKGEIFFQDQLCGIGGGLQHAPRTDPVRAGPQLHPTQNLPLREHGVRKRGHNDEEQDRGFEEHDEPRHRLTSQST
jgi:hypothetical protein